MKTYRHLYPQIWDWNNIEKAWRKARKGKRGRSPAATFEYDLETNLVQLRNELRDQTYQPGPYTSFYIHEPKQRLISAAPFRDRVVHHALCNVIGVCRQCHGSRGGESLSRRRRRADAAAQTRAEANERWRGWSLRRTLCAAGACAKRRANIQ